MGINDLAIIYQSKIYKIKGKIDILNSVGIKGQRYLKELEELDKETTRQIEDYNRDIKDKVYLKDLNAIYNNATARIEVIEGELEKYNSYIAGYHYCEYLDSKINRDKISEEEVKEYANKIIGLINSINETDTRDYNEEKEIVERIYSVAYQIMKLEYITRGRSEIFEVAKNNPVIESFISNEIAGDIHKLKDNNKITPLIKQSISRIQSNGINYSCLDKILITSIALEDDSSIINKIRTNLEELLTKMKDNTNEMQKLAREINDSEDTIAKYNKKINKNNKHNIKEMVKRTIAGLVAGAMLYGCYALGGLASKEKKYKTKKETFSSLTGYSSEEDYKSEVSDDYKSTKLYVYEPYEKYNDNSYRRDYTSYDISNISDDCNSLDDFLNLNLEHAASKENSHEDRNASDMSEEDFYDELLYEVVKTIQNPDDFHIDISYIYWVFTSFLLLILSGMLYVFIIAELYDEGYMDEIRKNSYTKSQVRKNLIDIKRKLETFRRLSDNNKEVKEEFTKIFNNYKELIESSDYINKIKENDSILIEDPQIVLDKRTKRLIKSRVKDK